MAELIETITADDPDELGIDLIVVHGVKTCSLQPLNDGWYDPMFKRTPPNTRLLEYDVDLDLSENFMWKDIQDRSTGLVQAICIEYKDIKALVRFELQDNLKNYLKAISGIAFFATPHITTCRDDTSQQLASILRYQSASLSEGLFIENDLTSLAWSSLKFAELKLHCPILSCYEQTPIKIGHDILGRPWSALADEPLARTAVFDGKLVAIDTELGSLLEASDCLVHCGFEEFLAGILSSAKEKREGCVIPLPVRDNTQTEVGDGTTTTTEQEASSDLSFNQLASFSRRSATVINSPSPLSPQNPCVVRTASQPNSESSSSFVVISQQDSSFASITSAEFRAITPFKSEASKVPDTVHYLPLAHQQPNPDFVGRRVVLEQMERCLLSTKSNCEDSGLRSCVLSGAAGIGKTQLALQFLHRQQSHFDVVLWVSAQSIDSLSVAFSEIAIKLGLETKENAKDPVASREIVKGWLAEPFQDFQMHQGARLSWILFFDGADEPDIVHDFWPYDGQGSVVVTSRDPMARSNIYFGETGIKLDTLDEEDAVALFQRLLESGTSPESYQVLLEVAKKLDYYPLAIVHMASVMRRLGYTPARFLQVYQSEYQQRGLHAFKVGTRQGCELTLAALWALKDMSAGAARLLSVISLLDSGSISEAILTTAPERTKLEDYPSLNFEHKLSELTSSSIVFRKAQSIIHAQNEITIHSLTQDVVRSQLLGSESQTVAVFNATIGLLTAVWPYVTRPQFGYHADNRIARWDQCEKILPHIKRLREMYGILSESVRPCCATLDYLDILSEVAWYHFERFNPEECMDYVQATLTTHSDSKEYHPRIVAGQYGTWAQIALRTNQCELGLEKMQEHLKIRESIFAETGVVDSHIAAAYSETARAMLMNGMSSEARTLIHRSIDLRKQMTKFSRLQLHSPLMYLSWIDCYEGSHQDAVDKLLEALQDREVEFGRDDQEGMRAGELLYYLGQVRNSQGFLKDSFQYHQRALSQFRATSGEDDFYTGLACYQVAGHTMRESDLSVTETLLEQAIKIFSRVKYNEPQLARAMFQQSKLLLCQGDDVGARSLLERSAVLRRQYVDFDLRLAEELEERDFEDVIVFWLR
ncbi:hypothetical protein JMJ35_009165 [Cladonia borealis]|uniref:NB-ARC domain-containing protein n=1 Tax=Cladonia borealis TaxID=184061 RepID=A0AA39QTE1_9LECA|nr:hypothetical protein JMJ35_009165 [Cladonia borealis]